LQTNLYNITPPLPPPPKKNIKAQQLNFCLFVMQSTPPSSQVPSAKRARSSSMQTDGEHVPASVKKYVKGVLSRNIEIKERVYVDNFTQTNNTGLSLAYPAQGVSNSERIGDEIRLHSIRIRAIVANLSAIGVNHYFRCIVYMSRSTSLLGFTDLFYGTPATQVPAIVNPNFLRLLADKTWVFDTAQKELDLWDLTIPLRNKKITFDNNSTTPKQDTIHLHFFQCDNLGTPVNNQCRVTYDVVLRFRDA